MTRAPRSVTIVGASLAGLNAAEALRREGFDGRVTLIGAETHLPYDRPPLSKQVLAGDWEPERAALTDPEELEEDGIEARLGVRATALDLDARELTLHSGETVAFDGLVIATGARCRTMPGTDQVGGVHVLRSLDDCLALRADLEAMPQRVVVVGAGFIGAEVAATARGRGLDVTMVEALPTPLSRVLGDEMGEVCAEVHRDHGVDLRTAVGVERISGDGRVERVTLSDGSTIDADVVVVGIGVIPNTEWLDGSGLEVDDGVMCDASCLAADRVAAAGDVARWPNALFGETMRVEHWDNAAQQGAHAARRLLDAAAGPFTPVPWFWSDQYDRKIQLAGRVRGDDEVRVVTGSVDERRFAAIYGRAGRIVGVLGFNRPRHVMRYRALIEQGASFDEALAAEF
ncbi:MAG: NAD(P)/FAD-dependent oxidoreductase [Acidimicrobiaceae bacterium]|nr:NAD(P)/FAD-dependent oxidoreductase [Acidimicrobiaceae bacterium]MYI53290.1 NAD(P)/FAD-dependent oxidoreductase [Acidimicrobiaceae bacterium]